MSACNFMLLFLGIFTADQKLKLQTAQSTRQNPNGDRSGYECPEERDYYPYWHSAPWIDIAVLTDDESRCAMYRRESFNVRPRGECVLNGNRFNKFNSAEACKANSGQWMEFRQYMEKLPSKFVFGQKREVNLQRDLCGYHGDDYPVAFKRG